MKKSILNKYGVPESVGVTVFLFCFILTLAPYFPNTDFGIFKVPTFTDSVVTVLQILGPILLLISLILFFPIIKQQDQNATDDPETEVSQLPTFEIGECTNNNPLTMSCTGELIGGLSAATRIVDEITLDTKPSDKRRFEVRVTAIERIRSYIKEQEKAGLLDREEKHKIKMALLDWEKQVTVFRAAVEMSLWNTVFRKSAQITSSKDVAEVVCGLSLHCFGKPNFPITWWMWYEGEPDTLQLFGVPDDFKDWLEKGFYQAEGSSVRRQGLWEYESYKITYFFPNRRAEFVFPKLLIFIANKKINGTSDGTLNKYLDISQWRWSISNPREFLTWK